MIGVIALGKLLVVVLIRILDCLLLVDLWACVPASRRLSHSLFSDKELLLCLVLLLFVCERRVIVHDLNRGLMKRGLLRLRFVEELSGTIFIKGGLDLSLLLHTGEHLVLI